MSAPAWVARRKSGIGVAHARLPQRRDDDAQAAHLAAIGGHLGVTGDLFGLVVAPLDQEVWQDLVDRSILVRNCASWPRLDDCLRLTLGTPDENTEFLAALAASLEPS